MRQTRPSDWWRWRGRLADVTETLVAWVCNKSPAKIGEAQSLLSTGAVLRLSFLSHKHLCGSNRKKITSSSVLRELQHHYFTCFHLTCISKWRKTQLQMSCTTFYHVDLKQLVRLEWRSEKWGGQTQSENSLPADWLFWPNFFLYVKKKCLHTSLSGEACDYGIPGTKMQKHTVIRGELWR